MDCWNLTQRTATTSKGTVSVLSPWIQVHLLTGVFLMLLVVWVVADKPAKRYAVLSAATTPGHTHLELLHA